MKKLLCIIALGLSFNVNSLAMSPEFKKEIFDGCYLNAKSTLGNQRTKQYCTCTTEMLHRKFSDEEILRIGQKSQDKQMQAFSFASNYCNKNADAPN
tara:strand:- start:144 stop:434 length:291 start_codon:yes stop_codon:yes gene_type:complete